MIDEVGERISSASRAGTLISGVSVPRLEMTAASRTEVYFNRDELEGEGLDPGDYTRDRLRVEVMAMLLDERVERGCGRVLGV